MSRYHFHGEGGVLVHAYYTKNYKYREIHFKNSENSIFEPNGNVAEDKIHFLSVSVH